MAQIISLFGLAAPSHPTWLKTQTSHSTHNYGTLKLKPSYILAPVECPKHIISVYVFIFINHPTADGVPESHEQGAVSVI
jgi:hypothetical protein